MVDLQRLKMAVKIALKMDDLHFMHNPTVV
jgi:hypothetical protein